MTQQLKARLTPKGMKRTLKNSLRTSLRGGKIGRGDRMRKGGQGDCHSDISTTSDKKMSICSNGGKGVMSLDQVSRFNGPSS